MQEVQLFLTITKTLSNSQWSVQVIPILKALPSAQHVMVIEKSQSRFAQISMTFDVERLSMEVIEQLVINSGTIITEIIIHFSASLTGTADPYGASAMSFLIEEKMILIAGVVNGAISSNGNLKIELNPGYNRKQTAIHQVIKTITAIRDGSA